MREARFTASAEPPTPCGSGPRRFQVLDALPREPTDELPRARLRGLFAAPAAAASTEA